MTADHIPDAGKMMPKALELADELEQYATSAIEKEVAREVRDLIREREALREDVQRFREAANCEREVRRQLERHKELLEAKLKQDLHHYMMAANAEAELVDELRKENDTLRQRCEQGYSVGRQSGREDCEALLRQALHLIETMPVKHPSQIGPRDALAQAIRERLK